LLSLRPEGIYCARGDFYIDPWRPVAQAVITHAHADHARVGHQQYHACSQGMGVLKLRLGNQNYFPHIYGERFLFNDVIVSLHPAGHILGSSQVRVEHQGEVWVVTGDFKRAPDPSCASFEVVPCDVLVTEATFALPIYRWQQPSEIAGEIFDWWQVCKARARTALLLCYSLGKAQRILAELRAFSDEQAWLHGAAHALTECYREAGVAMLPSAAVSQAEASERFSGSLVLAPPSALGSTWLKRFSKLSVGFASGWMAVRGQRRRASYDRGFVLSDHADWPALINTVRQSGARRVLATHGRSDALVRVLKERGIAAEALKTELGGAE
jgi:putative mRNA 3-end processing factor